VYPRKRGENYIYEGLILRFLKADWSYHDATNIVGYYETPIQPDDVPPELAQMAQKGFFAGNVVIDPSMALALLAKPRDLGRSVWVFRYYDLQRNFQGYAEALVRLIEFIRELAREKGKEPPRVNILAHSMGGLIVRHAIQRVIRPGEAEKLINKVVTLGTPHQGISFQVFRNWVGTEAEGELEQFNPELQRDARNPCSYLRLRESFPLDRLLTVVGTNYRTYRVPGSSALNRLFSVSGEGGLTYNRSDGLVKQAYAQIPGAPRTFVHKCHGGEDSLVTSREAFEIATRFFFGDLRIRLRLVSAKVTRGMDLFGKSEFFFGVGIKPRGVDFELFHQSAEAENCYGPFRTDDFTDPRTDGMFWWADDDRLVWEGWLDTRRIVRPPAGGPPDHKDDLAFRLDFYVGERDRHGLGFSDNVVFRKQYYVAAELDPLVLYLHDSERFVREGHPEEDRMPEDEEKGGWTFKVHGTGFDGTFRIELDRVA
jgi:pimeloyl-ACP methyl ester carboxylesterase